VFASRRTHESAVSAKRESKAVDFKRSFDPASVAEWCELIKDIVAMANSGGGTILIGVNNDGPLQRIGRLRPFST